MCTRNHHRAQRFGPAVAVILLFTASARSADDPLDLFLNADDARGASRAAERVIKDHVDFETIWTRLKAGRRYGPAPTGTQEYRFAGLGGVAFETEIEIPADYDPVRRWPVRVQLHGGVARPLDAARRRGHSLPGTTPQIYVYPRAWNEAMWWQFSQVENILRVLDKLKRQYNVDESLVYVTGFSDGGTGAYFFGMREVTPFSAVLPLHGHSGVLENPSVGADGRMFVGNLANRPLFVVNGGRDPLYPVAFVMPYIERLQRAGVEVTFKPQPDAGHEASWWPAERATFERFVADHPRPAHPERLSWETERSDRYNRADWLIIEKIEGASGHVQVVRHGNTIDARTRGVRTIRLLLSPDAIDFRQPVTVMVNGHQAFTGPVAKDPVVLLKWAARDNDRSRLYAAELKIEVP